MAEDEQHAPPPSTSARDDSEATATAANADAATAETAETAATDGAADDEEQHSEANQYGLQDLEKLPLLEQVHRLFHAIQMQYPYKETAAWKSLPVEQKKRMLEYIRDKRMRKAASKASASTAAAQAKEQQPQQQQSASSAPVALSAPVTTAAKAETNGQAAPSKPTVKSDPYLQMLQRRSITTTTVTSGAAAGVTPSFQETLGAAHPNSAYIAPAQVAQYADRKSRSARWRVVDAEFYDEKCGACGVVHKEFDGAKGALLKTMGAMMSTFGDFERPCADAVQEVKALALDQDCGHVRSELFVTDKQQPCKQTLVEIFHEEAAYYSRWREFRGESKHEQHELEDVEEDELAEELDLFAVSEAESVFNEAFLERIKFADERTKAMDWSIYDTFARGRKLNFMSSKGQQFRHWLRLGGKSSRASLEFMNFVAYHNIGRLVELAIKHRHSGVLQAMESPLVKSDIRAVATAFVPATQPLKWRAGDAEDEDELDERSQRVKVRRVSTKDGDITITERVAASLPLTAVAAASSSAAAAASTSPERSAAVSNSSAPTPSSEAKARPTRLKRLR